MEALFAHADLLAHVLSYCVRTTDVRFVCKRFYEVFKRKPLLHTSGRRVFLADYLLDVDWAQATAVCTAPTAPTRACFHASIGSDSTKDAKSLFSGLCEQQEERFVVWISESLKLHLCPLWPVMAPTSVVDLRPTLKKVKLSATDLKIETSPTSVVLWCKKPAFVACFGVKGNRELLLQSASLLAEEKEIARLCIVEGHGLAVSAQSKDGTRTLRLYACDTMRPVEPSPLPATGYVLTGGENVVVVGEGGFSSVRTAHHVTRLDLATGEALWDIEVQPLAHARLPGARSTGMLCRAYHRKTASLASAAAVSLEDGRELVAALGAEHLPEAFGTISFLCDAATDDFVGRMACYRNTVDGAAQCVFNGVEASFQLSIHLGCVGSVQQQMDAQLGMLMHVQPRTPSGLHFLCLRGVMYYGHAHSDTRVCEIVALRIADQSVLWTARMPEPCRCATHRLTLYAGSLRLACVSYPRDGGSFPIVTFLELHNGALCGEPVVLCPPAKDKQKCTVM
jgi:hypothetical protein